jgi:hypothetical protein
MKLESSFSSKFGKDTPANTSRGGFAILLYLPFRIYILMSAALGHKATEKSL